MIEPKHILRVKAYIENINSKNQNPVQDLFESFAELIVTQQEEITELKRYVEKQKQHDSDKSANGLDEYYRGTSNS